MNSVMTEGSCFCRYVSGTTPTDYVLGKYAAAHQVSGAFMLHSRFDRWLVAFASKSPAATRLCDSFARIFTPRSVLLRKLTLALAIVETSPEVHKNVDQSVTGKAVVVMSAVALHVMVGGIIAVAATLLLFPMLVCAKLVDRIR